MNTTASTKHVFRVIALIVKLVWHSLLRRALHALASITNTTPINAACSSATHVQKTTKAAPHSWQNGSASYHREDSAHTQHTLTAHTHTHEYMYTSPPQARRGGAHKCSHHTHDTHRSTQHTCMLHVLVLEYDTNTCTCPHIMTRPHARTHTSLALTLTDEGRFKIQIQNTKYKIQNT